MVDRVDSDSEQEIDLGKYVRVVARRWRTIRDIAILAVAAALLFVALAPRDYEAVARVAVVRNKTQVTFEDKIKTVSPDVDAAQNAIDTRSRRATLATLVSNPLIAQQVIQSLADRLPPGLRNPDVLAQAVEGRPARDADIVEIVVRGQDPTHLAPIANAWAVAYEQQVNRTYSGVGGSPATLENEAAAAKAQYDQAAQALVQFASTNREYELSQQIDDRKKMIEGLQKGRQGAIAAIIDKQTQAQADAIGRYLAAAAGVTSQPATKQANAGVDQLSTLYAVKLRNAQLLEDARTLRKQVGGPGASAESNALAIMILKAQMASPISLPANSSPPATSSSLPTGSSSSSLPANGSLPINLQVSSSSSSLPANGSLPINLQVSVGSPASSEQSTAAQARDLDALITALESRQQELDAAIAQQSTALVSGQGANTPDSSQVSGDNSPLIAQAQRMAGDLVRLQGVDKAVAALDQQSPTTDTIARLTAEIRQLETDLARSNNQKQELTRARDLTWQTYTTLASKAKETQVASQLPTSEVAFAVPASPPTRPTSDKTRPVVLAFAVIAGVLVGVVGVLIQEYASPNAPTLAIPWTAPIRWVRPARARPGVLPEQGPEQDKAHPSPEPVGTVGSARRE